jgi:phospholipid:diacylglycerol acyltransferase
MVGSGTDTTHLVPLSSPESMYIAVGLNLARYQHNPTSMVVDVRGGRDTADHVDIMGNIELLQDVMRIVSGSDAYDNRIFSDIEKISSKIRANIKKRYP